MVFTILAHINKDNNEIVIDTYERQLQQQLLDYLSVTDDIFEIN